MLEVKQPADFGQRILLAVAGGSPAIVTETLYALSLKSVPAYLPTAIHIITTDKGVSFLQPLLGDNNKIQALARDYGLPLPDILPHNIHVITDTTGQPLPDITTAANNENAADFITNKVRELTDVEYGDASLHVSIAGGRKTMSYYAGYALSLFGRMQDRLSHVLVDESQINQEFFYPPPNSEIEVMLADIPFVRLREGMGFAQELSKGKHTFNKAVDLVQRQFSGINIVVGRSGLFANNLPVHGNEFKDTGLAVYAWLLERHRNGKAPVVFKGDESNADYATELLTTYRRLYASEAPSRMKNALKKGMDASYPRKHFTYCNQALEGSLKNAAKDYLIKSRETGVAGEIEYYLPDTLLPKHISLLF